MYKSSNYNFFTKFNDDQIICYNALYDSLLIVSKDDYEVINYYINNPDELEINDKKLFLSLNKLGFFLKEEISELNIIRYFNKKQTFYSNLHWITINPTLNCNAKCWYCSTDLNAVSYEKKVMTKEIVESIMKRLDNLISSGNNIHLDWFGGEPLLGYSKVIMPIIQSVISHPDFSKIELTQHITTNASLLTMERIDYFNKNKLNSYQIALDGNKNTHNSVKKIAGFDSFSHILKCVNYILKTNPNARIVLRINYDSETLEEFGEYFNLFPKNKQLLFDFQRIWQIEKKAVNKNTILQNIISLIKNGYKVNFWAYRPRQYYTCYSDRYKHEVINFDGSVYKCTARNYSESMKVGRINTSGILEINELKLAKYLGVSTFENDKCLNCKILPLCFGPCCQKRLENIEQKTGFICLNTNSELSVEDYIYCRALEQSLISLT